MNSTPITCPFCGQTVASSLAPPAGPIQCPSCHKTFTRPPSIPREPPLLRPASGGRPGMAPSRPATGLAVASLVFSIVSFILGPLGFIPGIVCGHVARAQIRRNPALGGSGVALAGLIVSYMMLALTVVLIPLAFAVVIGIQKAQFRGQFPPPPRMERVEPLRSRPLTQTLRADVANNPISGTIEGSEFRVDEATINPAGHLSLRQTQGRGMQDIIIFLFPRPGEGVAGRAWNVPLHSNFTGTKPHVHLGWLENGGSKRRALSDGYELQLELGQEENGMMPGRLTLRIPGNPGTDVKGDFEAKVQ